MSETLSKLKENPENPRTISKDKFEKLKKNLTKFPKMLELRPIVYNKKNIVLGGNMRLKALRELQSENKIKVKESYFKKAETLTEAEQKDFIILDNQEFGDWDMDLLANSFEMDDLLDLGFDEKELTGLDFGDSKTEEELDEVPELQKEAIAQLGDIFLLDGKHRVMCGDSTNNEDAEKLMDGKTANISFQSPPYNAGDNSLGGNSKMVESKYINDNDNKTQPEYLSFLASFTSISLIFAELSFINIQQLANNKKAVIEYLYAYRDHYLDKSIWFKGGGQPAMAESVMNSRFEDVYIFDKNKNPKRVIRTNKFRNVSNVFEYNPSGKNESKGLHAATFPVAFPSHYISFATGINAIVLDLFLGSGSTLIACEQTNRICYGMEIDPIYIDVILRRYYNLYPDKKIECLTRKDFNLSDLFNASN